MAEISVIQVIQLAAEHGCPVTRDHAVAFLNENGHAYKMWMHLMQAGEDFMKRNLPRFPVKGGYQNKSLAVTPESFRNPVGQQIQP